MSYFGARYYSAALGQWISPDPLTVHGLGGGVNPYSYVTGNVFGAIDPLGLEEDPYPGGISREQWATELQAAGEHARTHEAAHAGTNEIVTKLYSVWKAPQVQSSTDIRWNPNSTSPTGTMLLGAPQEPTLADTHPEVNASLQHYGPGAVSLVPYVGTTVDLYTALNPDAESGTRLIAGGTAILGVVPVPGLKWVGNVVGKAFAKAFSKGVAPSSKALGRALEAAQHVRPANSAAHHIVAGEATRAAPARAVLDRFGIDINEAANGAFLDKAFHDHLHSNNYYDAVNDLLNQAASRQDALNILQSIQQSLLQGSFL